MTPAEVVAGLRAAARQSEDAAAACEAEVAVHRPEFERCLAAVTEANHARALELYPHVVQRTHEAAALRAEAELFREAAEIVAGCSFS